MRKHKPSVKSSKNRAIHPSLEPVYTAIREYWEKVQPALEQCAKENREQITQRYFSGQLPMKAGSHPPHIHQVFADRVLRYVPKRIQDTIEPFAPKMRVVDGPGNGEGKESKRIRPFGREWLEPFWVPGALDMLRDVFGQLDPLSDDEINPATFDGVKSCMFSALLEAEESVAQRFAICDEEFKSAIIQGNIPEYGLDENNLLFDLYLNHWPEVNYDTAYDALWELLKDGRVVRDRKLGTLRAVRIDFATEAVRFEGFRDRLLRMRSDEIPPRDDDANATIMGICEQAARLYRTIVDSGNPLIDDPEHWDQRIGDFGKHSGPRSLEHDLWWGAWLGLARCLSARYPSVLRSDPASFGGVPENAKRIPGSKDCEEIVVSTIAMPKATWRQRAEDHAAVMGVLAELCRERIGVVVKSKNNQEDNHAASLGCRSLRWFGEVYGFTAMQGVAVGLLYDAFKNGTPDVGIETLLETMKSTNSRLPDIFRDHPAWGTVIVDGATKGSKRLKPPEKI